MKTVYNEMHSDFKDLSNMLSKVLENIFLKPFNLIKYRNTVVLYSRTSIL